MSNDSIDTSILKITDGFKSHIIRTRMLRVSIILREFLDSYNTAELKTKKFHGFLFYSG